MNKSSRRPRQNIDLVREPIRPALVRLAMPIMASAFMATAYNLTDMAWVGTLGADAVAAAILRETSTFGVRRTDCSRYELARSLREEGGIRVKRGEGYGAAKEKPEFEDRARAARAGGKAIS